MITDHEMNVHVYPASYSKDMDGMVKLYGMPGIPGAKDSTCPINQADRSETSDNPFGDL